MDEILHHYETMGNHLLLVFTRESSFQGFLSGAGFCPPQYGGVPKIERHRLADSDSRSVSPGFLSGGVAPPAIRATKARFSQGK